MCSQLEDTGGRLDLTENEIELVRYIREDPAKWDSVVVSQTSGDP